MFVLWEALNGCHPANDLCSRGKYQKRHRLVTEEKRAGAEMEFKAYRNPITMELYFKYLGRLLSASDNNWLGAADNIWKDLYKWAYIYWILGQEGEDARASGICYKVVVQAVLLFVSETRVTNLLIGRTLGGFHHKVDLQMTYKQPMRNADETWRDPPLDEVMMEAGLEEVEIYVPHSYNTTKQYITSHPKMDLCVEVERRPGTRMNKRWQKQGIMELVGTRSEDKMEVEEV